MATALLFQLKDEEVADVEGSGLKSLSEVLPLCEEIPLVSDTISLLKSDTHASEPFLSEEIVQHTLNREFLLKIYHLPSFWKSLSSTKLTP